MSKSNACMSFVKKQIEKESGYLIKSINAQPRCVNRKGIKTTVPGRVNAYAKIQKYAEVEV